MTRRPDVAGRNVQVGYKQTDVGVIPEDWDSVRIVDVAQLESGHTPSKRVPSYWGGTVPWVSLHDTEVLDGREISNTMQTITEDGLNHSSARLLPQGTVVFSRTATIGKTTVMGRPMATSQDFANYICGPRLHNHFLVYLFRSMGTTWKSMMAGSIHNTVYMPVFEALKIPLPSITEQRLIAAALGDVDAVMGGLDATISKKRDLKQAAVQQLLTGQTRLPGTTGDWVERSLGDLFTFSGGVPASREQLSASGYPYLHYGDIHRGRRTFIDVDLEYQDIPKLDISLARVSPACLLEDGDVVFVDASEDVEGTSRHVLVVNGVRHPFIAGLHTIVAKARTVDVAHEYRRYCFQSHRVRDQFRFYAVGTKVFGVSKANISKITLLMPSMVDEQVAIAEALSDMDAEIEVLETRREKTRLLKQGMMQELLTGSTRLL